MTLSISSCASFDLAQKSGWRKIILQTNTSFDLVSYTPNNKKKHSDTLIIYIEGDGFAWHNRHTPSDNPTPKNPIAFKLAMAHNAETENTVYLARPCQYINLKTQPLCTPKYWTSHRFASEVIQSTNAAIDELKILYSAKHIKVVGYSGGGAIAALVAAKRNDVIELVTIAGNLDTEAWTKHHNISPLSGSLNPADYWQDLVDIPQTHYVGSNDKIVPPAIAQSYANRFPIGKTPDIIVEKAYAHHFFWEQ